MLNNDKHSSLLYKDVNDVEKDYSIAHRNALIKI